MRVASATADTSFPIIPSTSVIPASSSMAACVFVAVNPDVALLYSTSLAFWLSVSTKPLSASSSIAAWVVIAVKPEAVGS